MEGDDRSALTVLGPPKTEPHLLAALLRHASRRQLLRTFSAATAALWAIVLLRAANSVQPIEAPARDSVQEYLMAKAIVAGISPYLPMPALGERFLGPVEGYLLPHPSPHPPTLALLSLPLALMDYRSVTLLWCAAELLCLAATVRLILRAHGAHASPTVIVITSAALALWFPVREDLAWNQVMLPMLAVLGYAQYSLMAGRYARGGCLLGLSLLIKPIAWPVVLLLAFRQRWAAVVSAAATAAAAYLAAVLVLGPNCVLTYFTKVAPQVGYIYRGVSSNLSLWSVGWRLLEGTGCSIWASPTAPPLFRAPLLASTVSVLLPGACVLLGLAVAWRCRLSLESSLGLMICLSILASPIVWNHYMVLLLLPASYVVHTLVKQGLPRSRTNIALALAVPLAIHDDMWMGAALHLGGSSGASGTPPAIAFGPSLLTFMPTLSIIGLACFIALLGSRAYIERTGT